MSGRSNIFAKDAGALKPLEGSNPSGSARVKTRLKLALFGDKKWKSFPPLLHFIFPIFSVDN